jgi:hypothetical protein
MDGGLTLNHCSTPLILLLAGAAFLGCTHPGRAIGHIWPVSGPCQADESGTVTCGESRVAQVQCLPGPQPCRALGVRYDKDGAVVWLFGDGKPMSNERRQQKLDWAKVRDVIITRDGSSVFYWDRGILSSTAGTWHRYELMIDRESTVDASDVWKIWALMQENKAVWLGGPQPGLSVIHW